MYIRLPALEIAHSVELPSAIRSLSEDVGRVGERAITDIATDLVDFYQQEIVREGSIDTSHFLNTVRIRRQAWHERDVGSDATYAGVVKRKGTGEIIGPSIAGHAINRLGPSIESAFARQLMR